MLVALLALLAKRRDHVPKRTQALVNRLRLPQAIFILARSTSVEPFRAGKIDEVQRALAPLARVRVRAADAEREHRVRAGRALVHQRCGDGPPRVGEREQGAHLRGRREGFHDDIGDARVALFVLDLMLLLVELTLAEQIIDRFVVLECELMSSRIRGEDSKYRRFRGIGLPLCIPSLWP